MKSRTILPILIIAAACGKEPEAPAEQPRRAQPPVTRAEAPAPEQQLQVARPAPAGDAAEALRRYYRLISERRYEEAWRMRGGRSDGADRLAASFAAYERYKADVGAPGDPFEAGGWLYVEVPVMITGSFKGGKPFASSGSVTLRKARTAPGASSAQREWHIYTGGG